MTRARIGQQPTVAVLFVLLLTLPTVLSASPTPILPDARSVILMPERVPVPLDCADSVTLVINATAAPSSPQSRYAVLTLEGATGSVRINREELLEASAEQATHIVLRLSETDERVIVECAPGSVATLAYFDIPVVETLDLPARIIGATFTRPGLQALDFENLLEVFAVAPAAGNLTAAVHAQGVQVPVTLQALGARPMATAENWSAVPERVLDDEDAGQRLLDTLLRLAVICRQLPSAPAQVPAWALGTAAAHPLPCAGEELANLLSRYSVPVEAASDLAARLAGDSRCTVPQTVEWAVAPLGWSVGSPSPCGALVLEWLSDTADGEGLPATAPVLSAAAIFAGLDPDLANRTVREWLGLDDFFSGPCGGDPDDGPIPAIDNRTHPGRQSDCVELLAGPLRPIRVSWQENRVIRQMSSLNYGASTLSLTSRSAGEGKLTISTQGPVLFDITIGFDPLPTTIGEALGPIAPAVSSLGDRMDAEVEDSTWDDTQQWPIGPGLVGAASQAASDRAEGHQNATSGVAEKLLLAVTTDSCRVDGRSPADGTPCGSSDEPAYPSMTPAKGLHELWRVPAPEALPGPIDEAVPYNGADLTGALAAFLSPPGAMLAFAPPGAGQPTAKPPPNGIVDQLVDNAFGLAGEHTTHVFVPTRLQVRYDTLRPPGTDDLSNDTPADALVRFVADRLDALQQEGKDLRALLPADESVVPIEVLLTGATFHVHTDDGVTHVNRTFPSHRVVNVRDGVSRNDFDLDGIVNPQELEHTYRAAPGLPDDLVRSGSGLDPFNPDSDEDGMTDGYELVQCAGFQVVLAPCTRGLTPWLADGTGDADADGLTNREEFAYTHIELADSECFASLRWVCHRESAEAGLNGDCAAGALLAWSQDEGLFARSRDSDCDSAPDGWESAFAYDPLDPLDPALHDDADEDGLSNGQELGFYLDALGWMLGPGGFQLHQAAALARTAGPYGALLSPVDLDSDGDGAPDGWEAARGLWPALDDNGVPQDPHKLPRQLGAFHMDADQDHDGDGLTTAEEFAWSVRRLAPDLAHLDQSELLIHLESAGLDPLSADSDGDGLSDPTEQAGWENDLPCMDPVRASIDCDGDGLEDIFERYLAGDPHQTADANETARRFLPCTRHIDDMLDPVHFDWLAGDSDNDTMTDGYECWFGLDATNASDADLDPDGDGLTSRFEHQATTGILEEQGNDLSHLRPPPLDRDSHTVRTIRCPNFGEPAGATGYDRALLPTSDFPFELRGNDSDCDGMPDAYEHAFGLVATDVHDTSGDFDRDGLSNWEEYRYQRANVSAVLALEHAIEVNVTDSALVDLVRTFRLDPANADSDGDGMADGWEHSFRLNPVDTTDADGDLDGDGASNLDEYRFSAGRWADLVRQRGTLVLLEPDLSVRPDEVDTDGDEMADGFELDMHEVQGCLPTDTFESGPSEPSTWTTCFDPLDRRDAPADFDGDGLSNRREHDGWDVRVKRLKATNPDFDDRSVVTTYRTTSNPLSIDTSGGGLPDGEKAPRALARCPGTSYGLDPWQLDTDGDGVSDRVEVWEWTAVAALPLDIDGDCYPNAADTDSDGDSFTVNETVLIDMSDGEELDLKLTDPTRTDTDDDLLPDGAEIWSWREQNINPASPETDYNGDGRLPLRDPDTDNDLIPDGYEFRYGLEAWIYRNETYGTDDDGLSDLCEYRITVGGDRSMCPERVAETNQEPETISILDDQAPPGFDRSCMGAADRDCDGDGIDDGFEYINDGLPGCEPHRWTNHVATTGEWTSCLSEYIDTLGGTERERYESIFGDDLDKPVIQAILLQPKVAVGESGACFYHRACRGTLNLDREKLDVTVTITIQDRNCDLDRVEIQHRRGLKRRSSFIHITPAQRESCLTAANGLPDTYVLSKTVGGPWDRSGLGLFKPRLEVQARDDAGHTASVARKITLSGRGLSWLDDANNAFERSIAGSLEALGAELMRAAGEGLDQAARDAGEPLSNGVAYARHLVTRGLADYHTAIRWFGSEDYEVAMADCGIAPDPPFGRNPASCPEVGHQIRLIAGSRVKLLAGMTAIEDNTRPIADALRIGSDALFRSGMGHADVEGVVGPIVLAAAGRSGLDAETKNAWDAVMPQLLQKDDLDSGCAKSDAVVLAARVSQATSSDLPAGTPTLSDWRRAEPALRLAGYTRGEAWSHECTEHALARLGHSEADAVGRRVAISATQSFLLANAAVGTAAGADRLAATKMTGAMAGLAWLVIDGWIRINQPEWANHPTYQAACVLVAAAPMAPVFLAGGPIGGAVAGVIIVTSALGAAACLQPAGQQDTRHAGPEWFRDDQLNSVMSFNNGWSYALSTFPDVEAHEEADRTLVFRLPTDPRDRQLLGLRANGIMPDLLLADAFGCGDSTITFLGGVGLNVRVQVLRQGAWTDEAVVRVYRNGDEGRTDQWSDAGHRWTVQLFENDVRLALFGQPTPGLRRISMALVPEVLIETDGRTTRYPADPSSFASGESLTVRTGPAYHAKDREPVAPDRAPVSLGESLFLPIRPAPPKLQVSEGDQDFGTSWDCSLPITSTATVHRGIAADLGTHGLVSQLGRIVDTSAEAIGLERTFRARGAQGGAGYTYYWDVGGESGAAIVRTSADERIKWRYAQPGQYAVVLTVTDERGVRVQEIRETFEIINAPTETEWHPIRDGNRLSFSARITDLDDCLTYELVVAGEVWDKSDPCGPQSGSTNTAFEIQRDLSEEMPARTDASLIVYRDGEAVRHHKVKVSPAATDTLDHGPVISRFHPGYTQVDRFTYNVPAQTDLRTLSMHLQASPKMHLQPENPALMRSDGQRLEPYVSGDGLAGTSWSVSVHSGGDAGCYALYTNVQGEASCPTRLSIVCLWINCHQAQHRPSPPSEEIVVRRDFEPEPGSSGWSEAVAVRNREGPATWQATTSKASSGSGSAYMGRTSATHRYGPGAEQDILTLPIPAPPGMITGESLRVGFDEWASVNRRDTGALRSVQVRCVGFGFDDSLNSVVVAEEKFRGSTHRWKDRSLDFDCGALGDVKSWSIAIDFEWTSTQGAEGKSCLKILFFRHCNSHHAQGWYVDNVRIAKT